MDTSEYHRIADAEDSHWWYRSTRRLVRSLLADALRPGIVSLDIGAGPGGNGAWLTEFGTVIALDVEAIALEYVRTRRPGLVPVQGSAIALPFAEASIDVVMALTVLYHVVDDAEALREIARVLKPGGVALVLEPAFPSLRREHDNLTHGVRRYRRNGLERLARDAGLDVTRSTYAKSYLFVPAALIALTQRMLRSKRAGHEPRSDLEPRRIDRAVAPLIGTITAIEDRVLARRNIPIGTSVLVVARRNR